MISCAATFKRNKIVYVLMYISGYSIGLSSFFSQLSSLKDTLASLLITDWLIHAICDHFKMHHIIDKEIEEKKKIIMGREHKK